MLNYIYFEDCESQRFVTTTILVTYVTILTKLELVNMTFVLCFNADSVKKLI